MAQKKSNTNIFSSYISPSIPKKTQHYLDVLHFLQTKENEIEKEKCFE